MKFRNKIYPAFLFPFSILNSYVWNFILSVIFFLHHSMNFNQSFFVVVFFHVLQSCITLSVLLIRWKGWGRADGRERGASAKAKRHGICVGVPSTAQSSFIIYEFIIISNCYYCYYCYCYYYYYYYYYYYPIFLFVFYKRLSFAT